LKLTHCHTAMLETAHVDSAYCVTVLVWTSPLIWASDN